LCHFYRGEAELKEVTLPFLCDGLANGEQCLFVADPATVESWYRDFEAYGVDVVAARKAGALSITPSDEWRGMCEGKSSIAMAREVLALVGHQLQAYPALRIVGDVAWYTEPAVAADALCHWEATANLVFEGLPVRAICQYDTDRYGPEYLEAALRTHTVILYQGRRVRNPHYEALMILEREPNINACTSDTESVNDKLSHLLSSSGTGKQGGW